MLVEPGKLDALADDALETDDGPDAAAAATMRPSEEVEADLFDAPMDGSTSVTHLLVSWG